MAWCPKCDGNYQIVVSVKGSPQVVPVISDRYNLEGECIGYETGAISKVDIESLPRCSNCYSVLKFPNVTSKKEYFYAERDLRIQSLRARKPSEPTPTGLGCAVMCVVATLLVGVTAYFISQSLLSAAFIGLLVAVGLGLFFRWDKREHTKMRKKYESKLKRWQEELNELQSLEYSDENYERCLREWRKAIEEEKLSEFEKEIIESVAEEKGIDPREALQRWRQWKKGEEERKKKRKEKWGF